MKLVYDGNFLITSYYRDGTTVHDITYPNYMIQVGSYDSYLGSGNGFDGALSGANPSDNIFRIGRASNVHNNYFGGVINQVAIWDSNETSNISTIYNSGVVQDLSLLASAPDHYYEIETSVTTITDIEGSGDLTGYNFVSGDLVTDTP